MEGDTNLLPDVLVLSEDELLQRQKQEKKDLQAHIQKLKKTVNSSKKRKKEVTEEILKLEADLSSRHQQELERCKQSRNCLILTEQVAQGFNNLTIDDKPSPASEKGKPSRAAKRRAKKAEEALQKEQEIAAEKEQALLTGPRAVEAKNIAKLLLARKLTEVEVAADGDCLFAAVSQQLGGTPTSDELRRCAADYILTHKDDFLPFIIDADTGDMLESEQFGEYCSNIANTHVWGGQPELRALSQHLKRKIEVIQAEGTSIILGEEFSGPPLLMVYYRHKYTLGEHYNGLLPTSNCEADVQLS